MKRFKRFLTAPLRLRTSHGFGVHSPFAYSFITGVLSQNYHYYSYIEQNRRNNAVAALYGHHMLNPVRYQHLVFRVVNYFSPSVIVAVGYGSGLETMAALDVSCHSKVIQTGIGVPTKQYRMATASVCDRIVKATSLHAASEQLPDNETPVIIVNESGDDYLSEFLLNVLNNGGVVIFTNLGELAGVWEEVNDNLTTHGMTFSNNRGGVIVGLHYLPRQRFRLWL